MLRTWWRTSRRRLHSELRFTKPLAMTNTNSIFPLSFFFFFFLLFLPFPFLSPLFPSSILLFSILHELYVPSGTAWSCGQDLTLFPDPWIFDLTRQKLPYSVFPTSDTLFSSFVSSSVHPSPILELCQSPRPLCLVFFILSMMAA